MQCGVVEIDAVPDELSIDSREQNHFADQETYLENDIGFVPVESEDTSPSLVYSCDPQGMKVHTRHAHHRSEVRRRKARDFGPFLSFLPKF
jgi:hypothetical protein